MLKIKTLSLLIFTVFFCRMLDAQNNTNSPYTMYGYGDVSDNVSGDQRAMGGVAIASHAKTSINTINPASYSAVDTMTFMLDLGVSALTSKLSTNTLGNYKFNSNLEYVTMQFPLWKNTGFSVGVLPFSFTGYNYSASENLPTSLFPDTIIASRTFFGQGGINQAYMGFSIKLLKHLSLGVNTYYMFGNNLNSRQLTFSSAGFNPSYQKDSIKVNSFRFRYGLQYTQTFTNKNDLTVGAYYEMKSQLHANFSQSTGSIINMPTPYSAVFEQYEMPQMLGVGLNYMHNKQLSFGLDYSIQQWSKALFKGEYALTDRTKLALGVEYIPNSRARKLTNKLSYRAGFHISDSYYTINGVSQPKNFGIAFGLGMPLRNSKSVVNATIEYGKIGSAATLREDYLKFTLNAVINENWFFKRKL
ncbi:MAG: hypothetical protein AUK44_04585 [Porphyromonadaceae bacterium CG2_30_38_12]|nr:MAG: hypothetical protein AUK44_04585 [Porphyromonadaceae bacterium CG2_30_38_12]